jgi:hypothetical protein
MAIGCTTIKDQFVSPAAVTAYNAAFTAVGLSGLDANSTLCRQRRLLHGVSRLPSLAVELGKVRGSHEGSGLYALTGEVTLHLAIGRADDLTRVALADAYADALREAVESALVGSFQQLTFGETQPEGEVYSAGGLALLIVPVRFAFQWLYTV